MADEELEYVHDWVQWVFPTDEQSAFNGSAPLLTSELSLQCMKDQEIVENMKKSLKRFLEFLGLELQAGPPVAVRKREREEFKSRVRTCWTSMVGFGNHNWLRISRVLHCLGMVGLLEYQQAFMTFLEELCHDQDFHEMDRFALQRSLPHWQGRAKTRPVALAIGEEAGAGDNAEEA